jgi:hypothetical protein
MSASCLILVVDVRYRNIISMIISTFIEWSKEKGIRTTASVEETPYAGYGLFSTETIENNSPTIVVHIPADTLLTSQKALQVDSKFTKDIYHLISKKYNTRENIKLLAQSAENERLVLCLFLIYCKFFNTSTDWKPYIDILPTITFFKYNHILFNTEYVSGTSLDISIRAKLSSLKRELDEINDIEQDEEGEAEDADCGSTWLSKIQFEMYIWADCVFWSRVVGVGGDEDSKSLGSPSADMSLIPFFDFANHSAENSNIRWQPNKEIGGLDLVTHPGDIIEKGRELLLSYGSKPNQELLFLYGFCIENNPEHSRVTLPLLPFLNPAEAPYNLQKIQWLKQIGAKPTLTIVNEDDNLKNGDLMSCGWTFDSIVTMYLVALDEDNEIAFDEDEDHIIFTLSGERIETLEDLEKGVKKMDILPIIKIRAAVLLVDALEHHYSMMMDSGASIKEEKESSLWKQAQIYKLEEEHTVKTAIDNLSEIRDNLMHDPIVMAFLESAE